jgi:hypothetical protein
VTAVAPSPVPTPSAAPLGADRPTGVPAPIERLVACAARLVQPLATLTPTDGCSERRRLVSQLCAGRPLAPRWSYSPVPHDELRRALDAAEEELVGRDEPLAALYLARVRELRLEADLCAAAGTSAVARLARLRFAPPDEAVERAAADLSLRWLRDPAPLPCGDRIRSDAPDPGSLLSRMRRAVGETRMPFAVVACSGLAPLAATGERIILVAAGRMVCEEDAVRTVLHEVEGHARPRARAEGARVALFGAGTAKGTDHQEGLALLLEERAGLLSARRRRQLASRHRAVVAMLGGATFGDVATMLVAQGIEPADAVLAAERVFRGGDGSRPGLGRERIYLESLLRVREHLAESPEDERVLSAGQVSVDAAPALRAWV